MEQKAPTAEQQLNAMIATNDRIIRVLKRGFYPASVSADVQRAIDYLKGVTSMTRQSLKNLPKETAEVKDETPQVPDAPKVA